MDKHWALFPTIVIAISSIDPCITASINDFYCWSISTHYAVSQLHRGNQGHDMSNQICTLHFTFLI